MTDIGELVSEALDAAPNSLARGLDAIPDTSGNVFCAFPNIVPKVLDPFPCVGGFVFDSVPNSGSGFPDGLPPIGFDLVSGGFSELLSSGDLIGNVFPLLDNLFRGGINSDSQKRDY